MATVRLVILVRHAHAGVKAAWHHDDGLRPLSALGRAQASSLGDSLARERVDLVWSSPAVRCRQSVTPLAVARGVGILGTQLLAKDTQIEVLLEWLLSHHDSAWVLCTHGEVFTALLGAGVSAGLITTPTRVTEKGAAWRVTRAGDAPLALEYLPPSPRTSRRGQ